MSAADLHEDLREMHVVLQTQRVLLVDDVFDIAAEIVARSGLDAARIREIEDGIARLRATSKVDDEFSERMSSLVANLNAALNAS